MPDTGTIARRNETDIENVSSRLTEIMDNERTYFASGKLLLFGEYLVLRGTRCLAMPLQFGQKLTLSPIDDNTIQWQCWEQGRQWLHIHFSKDLNILETDNLQAAQRIQYLLSYIKRRGQQLNFGGLTFRFDLDFDRQLGFGTSSTLISLLSQWSGINPYLLLNQSFRGSGYDVAAAMASGPFVYAMPLQLEVGAHWINEIVLPKAITDRLLFVYSGQKQDSKNEVKSFEQRPTQTFELSKMDNIITQAAKCTNIEIWEHLMQSSEGLLSEILDQKPVQEQDFTDYPYRIKSLGAWGGDFLMATCRDINLSKEYFRQKGKNLFFTYNELIKANG